MKQQKPYNKNKDLMHNPISTRNNKRYPKKKKKILFHWEIILILLIDRDLGDNQSATIIFEFQIRLKEEGKREKKKYTFSAQFNKVAKKLKIRGETKIFNPKNKIERRIAINPSKVGQNQLRDRFSHRVIKRVSSQ